MTSEATQITQLVNESDDLPTSWGRWGERDERGTVNLITDEVRAQAIAGARAGRTVSLARPLPTTPVVAGPRAPSAADSTAVLQAALFTGASPRAKAELVVMMTHHPEVTYFDALVHQVLDGKVYPGLALEESAGPLPDGHGVTGAELEAACARAGVEVRGGWDYPASRARHLPGMTLDAVAWMHWHDVAVYVGDIGDAHLPIDPRLPGPLHRVALPRLGMPLIDVADLTALAAACAEESRVTFLFVAAPRPWAAPAACLLTRSPSSERQGKQ
jgi:hypothetical protein